MLLNCLALLAGFGLFLFAAQTATTAPGWAVAFAGIGGFLVLPYFIYGSVAESLDALRRRDIDAARELIGQTPFPGCLVGPLRGCYHWILGILAWDAANWPEARVRLTTALRCAALAGDARALLMGHLAIALAGGGDSRAAREQLAAARAVPHSPAVADYLTALEPALEPAAWLPESDGRWKLSPRDAFTALAPHATYPR
jgi:hypothetical protein